MSIARKQAGLGVSTSKLANMSEVRRLQVATPEMAINIPQIRYYMVSEWLI